MLAAIETSLTSADTATKLSLSKFNGFTVPIEAERVLTQAVLMCATNYSEDDSKEGIAQLTALLQKLGISTKAKKPNTMLAEKLMKVLRRKLAIEIH